MLFNPITDYGREEKKMAHKKKVHSKKVKGMVSEAKAKHPKDAMIAPMAHKRMSKGK